MFNKMCINLFVNQLQNKVTQQSKLSYPLATLIIRGKSSAIQQQNDRADISVDETGIPKLNNYTPQEANNILECINKCSGDDLLSYDISKTRAKKLATWKERNGPLRSLQDIFLVDGFGVKVADKFYKSLLGESNGSGDASKKLQRPRHAPFISPSIASEQQQNIRSCVSVRVAVTSVTWSRLELPSDNAPCRLTHWQYHSINEKKLHLNDLVNHCLYINQSIPVADCYLFENPQMAQASTNPGNPEQQNVSIQKSQITAILCYALSARAGAISQTQAPMRSNVFYLRRFLTARLFKHLIGSERVSTEQTIRNLMRTHYNAEDCDVDQHDYSTADDLATPGTNSRLSLRGSVQFPQDLRHVYSKAEGYHREFLGQTLLLNLAFVRLVLLQDPDSIDQVTRTSNKNKEIQLNV